MNKYNDDYLSALCFSREKNLISRDEMLRLTSLSIDDAVAFVKGKGFGSNETENTEDIIKEEEKKFIDFIKEYSPDKSYTEFKLLGYDYHNAEVLLRCKFLSLDENKYIKNTGLYSIAEIKEFLETGKTELRKELCEALTEGKALFESDCASGEKINILFLKHKYKDLLKVSKKFVKLVKTEIDFLNISSSIRSNSKEYIDLFFIDGGFIKKEVCYKIANGTLKKEDFSEYKEVLMSSVNDGVLSKPLTELEKTKDNLIMDYLMKDKYTLYGKDRFFLYCQYLENQIKNMRIIFVGISAGLDKNVIAERLRLNYAG